MLEAVRRIASAVAIPVTADLEAGYGPTVDDAVETTRGARGTYTSFTENALPLRDFNRMFER